MKMRQQGCLKGSDDMKTHQRKNKIRYHRKNKYRYAGLLINKVGVYFFNNVDYAYTSTGDCVSIGGDGYFPISTKVFAR